MEVNPETYEVRAGIGRRRRRQALAVLFETTDQVDTLDLG
jgi:hypothetical protein